MINISYVDVSGIDAAIRGMRNPMNSWDKSDSYYERDDDDQWVFEVGPNDLKLMQTLYKAGTDHRKFMRMITVTMDITAPTFWWAEFDTYKVGTVRNSCSKMHKIHVKPFELSDFTHEGCDTVPYAMVALEEVIKTCERLRQDFNETQNKDYWRALIELLPEGFNLRATVFLNYEVCANMRHSRKTHKLFEWHKLCETFEKLPYFMDIIGGTQ